MKLVVLAFFSLLWFLLIQAEYEMITKPELQNEFPIVKGAYAVYFLGFILLVISVIIAYLLFLILTFRKRGSIIPKPSTHKPHEYKE
jgi:hypothetical protein